MRDTLRVHKSTAYSEVRYSPSPLYTLGHAYRVNHWKERVETLHVARASLLWFEMNQVEGHRDIKPVSKLCNQVL